MCNASRIEQPMSDVRSISRPASGWLTAGAAFVLFLTGAFGAWHAVGQTVPSGSFRFSASSYRVTENETFQAGLVNPVFLPTKNARSVQGAVLTVVRENGTSGRVHVPFTTVDVPGTCGDTNSNLAVPFDPFLGCGDYVPISGTLVFDEFELSKSFMVIVLPDGVLSGNKLFDVSLGTPFLDPEESPDLLPPDVSDPGATVTIVEINSGNLAA